MHADSQTDRGDYDGQYVDQFNNLHDPRHYCPPSPYEKEHTVWGKIWPVTGLDGRPFATDMGSLVQFVDIPDRFLRKLLPDEVLDAHETATSVGV